MSKESTSNVTESSKTLDLASLLADPKRRIDRTVWEEICPGLSIGGGTERKPSATIVGDKKQDLEYRKEKLICDGYALVDDPFDVRSVREGIEGLHRQNIPATFVLLFDEAWELACESKTVLESATHEKNVFNYDLLAWYIPPGSPGFSPHRDRQPEDAPSTFHSETFQAKFVTNWIALSDATPQNSCLYVIPKPYDPGYTTGDLEQTDPLHRALATKEAFQHIRCLPRKAGQSILFTHRIIHWGSQGDVKNVSPRIAISFVCSDPQYEAPLLKDFDLSSGYPEVSIRLLLVCAQLLIYYQRFDLSKSLIKACYDYCKEHEDKLEETYRRKVYVEFVNAMKEQHETERRNQNGNKEERMKDDDDDDEDAMLEEMLNAEAGGYGEFEDDYDDIEEGDDNGIDAIDNGDDDDDEEEEEAFDLFGGKDERTDAESPPAKKARTL